MLRMKSFTLPLAAVTLSLFLAGCGGGGGGGGSAPSSGATGNTGGGGGSNVTRSFDIANFGGAQVATGVISFQPANQTGAAASIGATGTNRGLAGGASGSASVRASDAGPSQSRGSRDLPPEIEAAELSARRNAAKRMQRAGLEMPGSARFEDADIPEGGDTTFFIVTTGQNRTVRKMHADADTSSVIVFAEVVSGTPVINKALALQIDSRFGTNNPFDSNGTGIGPRVRSIFGSEWNAGGGRDGQTKVVLVLLSSNGIGGAGLYGFFRPNDAYAKSQVANSNEGEILYLNATYFSGDMYDGLATVAHEFQHMCNFNQKFIRQGAFSGSDEDDTINEGQSVLAEELSGFGLTSSGGGNSFMFESAKAYLDNPETYPFFTFGNDGGDYGKGYLMMKYLRDRFGTATITGIATSTNVSAANIAAVTGRSFNTLFQEWALANLLDPVTGAPVQFTYPNLALQANYSIRGLGTVLLPAASPERTFNPPTSSANLTLDPWTTTYLRYSGGDGSALNTSFSVPSTSAVNMVLETPAQGTYGSTQ